MHPVGKGLKRIANGAYSLAYKKSSKNMTARNTPAIVL